MGAIGETMATKAEADPMVQRPGLLEMAGLYLGGADPRSPLAAPIYADLKGLAPLLIQGGAAETLLDDAIRLAKAAGAADVRVDLLARDGSCLAHATKLATRSPVAGRRCCRASVPAHPCWDQAVPNCSPLTGWAPGPVAASRPSGAAASSATARRVTPRGVYLTGRESAQPNGTEGSNPLPCG
jgi:acetyl esterase/lipase